jgi:RNase P subunit RPR2
VIVACGFCGQQNRLPMQPVPSGKRAICGRCKAPLPVPPTPDVDDDLDALFEEGGQL